MDEGDTHPKLTDAMQLSIIAMQNAHHRFMRAMVHAHRNQMLIQIFRIYSCSREIAQMLGAEQERLSKSISDPDRIEVIE